MYAEATGRKQDDFARMLSPQISGTANTCTTIRFYVHTYGADIGILNMYLLEDEPYYFGSPIWQRNQIDEDKWVEQEVTLLVSFNYSVRLATC